MIRFIFYRLVIAIPVLWVISLLAFYLKEIAQADQRLLSTEDTRFNPVSGPQTFESAPKAQPQFYLAIRPHRFPDTLYRIKDNRLVKRATSWLRQGYAWDQVQAYLGAEEKIFNSTIYQPYLQSSFISRAESATDLSALAAVLPDSVESYPAVQDWKASMIALTSSRNRWALLIPSIHWYGSDNAYHQWIREILVGQWGQSTIDNRPVWTKIAEAISWTLSLNFIVLCVVFLSAIFFGEYLLRHEHKSRMIWLEGLLFLLHSIPRFFLALIMILAFASDTIHPALHFFPSPGFIEGGEGASIFYKWWLHGSSMILPLFCMILPSLAFISRMYFVKLKHEKIKPYAFHAWAGGLEDEQIIIRHLRRNALLPILALIGMEIPALIGGSVVIEVLFNIPGMGRLMMQSIVMQDWPVVFGILFMTGLLTVLGKLLTDILFNQWDSRISWSNQQ